jgi:4-amino-4-deoxy-L-arabinose transferase-like glycosyltransferase
MTEALHTRLTGEAVSAHLPSRDTGRTWPWLGLSGVVLLALALRCWGLERDGYGNEYYSAGVRSMLESWHNFFFNSFDPAGFVSLDKPPVAFWIQAASAKLFGFSGLSVLLPQALEGVAAIVLLFHIVARRFGAACGLLAALFLALTPVSVAVDRSTNTESCLVLVLLLSAWALSLAAERGSLRLLLLSMALLGIGFNVKMLAALVVVPSFLLVYGLGAPLALRTRLGHGMAALVVLAAVSLSWSVAFDATPASARPFAGSSQGNSMLELAFDHNGLQRFIRHGRRLLGGAENVTSAQPGAAASSPASPPGAGPPTQTTRQRPDTVPAGPLRLVSPFLAGQVGWLLPLAVLGLIAAVPKSRPALPLPPVAQAILLWGGWAASYAAIFSGAGGIFHAYYLATLAPPLAALAALGATSLWRRHGSGDWSSLALPGALLATAAWQYVVAARSPGAADVAWWPWLGLVLIFGAALSILALLAPLPGQARLAGFGVGLVAILTTPAAWALSSVVSASHVEFPYAGAWQRTALDDPALRDARARQIADLLAFLRDRRRGEHFLVATPDARRAAPLIIASGEAVMAMGGYMGADSILTPEALALMAQRREVRFVMVVPEDEADQRTSHGAALAAWVRQNGRLVDPALWHPAHDQPTDIDAAAPPRERSTRRSPRSLAALELYDLSSPDDETAPRPDGIEIAK